MSCHCCDSPNVTVTVFLSSGAEIILCFFCFRAWGYSKSHPFKINDEVVAESLI